MDSSPLAFSTWVGQTALAEFRQIGVHREFEAGELLFMEDSTPGNVLFIESGLITVYVTANVGTELILGIYGRGHLLCEVSALEQTPRSASGRGRTAGAVTEISGLAFRAFVARHPEAMRYILTAVRLRLRRAERERLSYLSVDVRGRVARTLLTWAESFGIRTGSQVTISGFSRRELAQTVGASPKSVDEALAALTANGALRTGRLQFVLSDLPRLRALGSADS
ncbi:Crp/Fnr family transcriptional regulator [Amycolatopsis sp. NPDC005232]|uniref:Crp/Fnr family transcriptional regulator n=1 Tax=Amycolatopsis sp. NPDC005232 TaxID=3157027 RepID=UPI0033A773F1